MEHVVLLDSSHGPHVYGPFRDVVEAEKFAEFLTAEVDPASVLRLIPAVDELLGWWAHTRSRETEPLAEEGMWPPRLGDVWQDKRGDRWLAVPGEQLLHMANRNGAAPYAEIWRLFGPLTIVRRTEAHEEEVPF